MSFSHQQSSKNISNYCSSAILQNKIIIKYIKKKKKYQTNKFLNVNLIQLGKEELTLNITLLIEFNKFV